MNDTRATDLLARQRRLLFFIGVVLLAQLVNTLFLWSRSGDFPVWSGMATLGLTLFGVSVLRRYQRLRALPAPSSGKPKRKRRRLRDPHRGQG